MKSKLWIGTFLAILGVSMITACGKGSSTGFIGCTDEPVSADSAVLLNYASGNGITPVKDTSGLYYQMISQGSGATPNANSTLYVSYEGILMSGAVFDSTTNSAKTGYPLGQLIRGWQLGLPKIQVGGRIKLLIPSHLAYGCAGQPPIVPGDSPLYFDITLVNIQ
jgi:FKBP-type peptidyl-prolyl cis-trans isomerase FkpA